MKSGLYPRYLSAVLIAAFAVSALLLPEAGSAIMVKPGKLDHFVVQIPEDIRAGEEFAVRLQVYDAHDNLITDFDRTGSDIRVSVTGSAEAAPQMIKKSLFTSGAAGVTVIDKKAEAVVFSLYEAGGTVPIYTTEITVAPNKLDRFAVNAPEKVQAGSNFEARLVAKDAYGNTVKNNGLGSDIKIYSVGRSEIKNPRTPAFKDGASTVTLMAEKTGVAVFEVRDIAKGATGRSADITVVPAPLDHFTVRAPAGVEAGSPFEVQITATDAYNNVAYDYSSYGGGVNVTSSGSSSVSPPFIKASEFKDGHAVLNLVYEKAEDIVLKAAENNKTAEGRSSGISVTPAGIERFVVTTPGDTVAGQKFRLKIEAYDRFDNLIRDFNLRGSDVILRASGKGNLAPETVPASEFVDGAASLEASYDMAENLVISASVVGKTEAAQTGKKTEMKTEVKEKPKPETKEEAAPKKAPAAVTKPEPKPETKPEIKKEPAAKEPEVTAKPAPLKTAKKEPVKAVKEEAAPAKVFAVSEINIIEAQNKALLVINIIGMSNELEYKEGLESSGGKDWVRLRLKPAENRLKKSPVFKSMFIGEVKVKQGPSQGELDILFDLLPSKVKYDIKRAEDSLVIGITPF
ncbi:MAG: hypothetical protein Q8J64_01180 [Thermodesulfovibrionales bacterium]|nr:hypothetical protein [Thermodesulfovibrionales bacterium]